MKVKLKELQDLKILRKLEKAYNVKEVKYDILNYNFKYLKGDEEKEIALDKLISHIYADVPKDDVLLQLEKVANDLVPQYINSRMVEFYQLHEISLPDSLYIFKGLIQFIDRDGDVYYVSFDADFDKVLKQLEKII